MSVFLDTNILIYAVLGEDDHPERQSVAHSLLDRDDCALSVQVLNEFVNQSTRPSRPVRLSMDMALRNVAVWRRFPVQDLTLALFDDAVRVHARGGFAWWDAPFAPPPAPRAVTFSIPRTCRTGGSSIACGS